MLIGTDVLGLTKFSWIFSTQKLSQGPARTPLSHYEPAQKHTIQPPKQYITNNVSLFHPFPKLDYRLKSIDRSPETAILCSPPNINK